MDVVLLVIAKLIFIYLFIYLFLDNLIIGGRGNLNALGVVW